MPKSKKGKGKGKKKSKEKVDHYVNHLQLTLHFESLTGALKIPILLDIDATVGDLFQILWKRTYSLTEDGVGPAYLLFPLRGPSKVLDYRFDANRKLLQDVGILKTDDILFMPENSKMIELTHGGSLETIQNDFSVGSLTGREYK
eukprot:g1427.t1